MNIDYNDERFQQVNNEKQAALNTVNNTYDSMINNTNKYYDDLKAETERYGKQQQELQQQKSDFAIEQINQQKDWAKQDYTKEQKAAYKDYMKETDRYGVNAEQMAQNGLLGTGYSETSKVSMYNTYQNRVATARESYNRAVTEYDLAIKDAQLSNNATLAELAHNTLQAKLELALQGFQYTNTLMQNKLSAQNETEDRYYNRWQNVLQQINTEKAFEYQKERDRIADEQWNKTYALSAAKTYSDINGSAKSADLTDGGNLSYTDTGAQLSGYPIYKASDGKYYYNYNGEYRVLPDVVGDSEGALTLGNGTVLTKGDGKKMTFKERFQQAKAELESKSKKNKK